MKFNVHVLDEDLSSEQQVLSVVVPDTITEITAIKLVAKNMRNGHGLGYNVTMEKVANTIKDTLDAFETAGKLDVDTYLQTIQLFDPFIVRARSWGELKDLMKGVSF